MKKLMIAVAIVCTMFAFPACGKNADNKTENNVNLTNTNWKEPVEVEGKYYTETNEYLSSTKESDNAFKYLIDYFKKQDEPTIICMFGDHQPSIETEFYEELLGKKQDEWEISDIQKRYATPFVLWANYDIETS